MSVDRNAHIETPAVVAPAPGQGKIRKRYQFLYLGALCGGLLVVLANPVTNVYTEWWAGWGIPAVVTVLVAIPPWLWTWKNPTGRLVFKRAEPIELGPISGRLFGVLVGLLMGALIGFIAHEVLQVVGAALPGSNRLISATVVSLENGGRRDRCYKHATFKFSSDETQEVCVDHEWRANVTDDKLDIGESVRMTLKGNAIGEWIISIGRDESEGR